MRVKYVVLWSRYTSAHWMTYDNHVQLRSYLQASRREATKQHYCCSCKTFVFVPGRHILHTDSTRTYVKAKQGKELHPCWHRTEKNKTKNTCGSRQVIFHVATIEKAACKPKHIINTVRTRRQDRTGNGNKMASLTKQSRPNAAYFLFRHNGKLQSGLLDSLPEIDLFQHRSANPVPFRFDSRDRREPRSTDICQLESRQALSV